MLLRSCVLPGCPGRRELEPDAYACPDCQLRLVRKLADIEDYLTIVSPVPTRGAPGPRAKGFRSTPPLRLDVVAMLDPRTEINGASGAEYEDGEDDILDEVPNVNADLDGWSRILQEEHPDHPPGSGAWYLRAWCSWACQQPWVDEFARDVTRVHGALRRACGDDPGKPMGHCLAAACGGEVFRRSDDPRDPRLRCGRCRTSYDGLDLVRIRSAS